MINEFTIDLAPWVFIYIHACNKFPRILIIKKKIYFFSQILWNDQWQNEEIFAEMPQEKLSFFYLRDSFKDIFLILDKNKKKKTLYCVEKRSSGWKSVICINV